MSVITVKDTCPHCGMETIVYTENDDSVFEFRDCLYYKKTLGDLPWRKKAWCIARELKPEKGV